MDKQRRHVTIACDSCRRQKIRCDCQNPCSSCKKSSRICIYSPRRRRGPAPKIATSSPPKDEDEPEPAPQQGQLSATYVINYYFRIILGTLSKVFQLADWDLVSDPTVNSQQLSNARKFQLFSALANCSRSTGNFSLAQKFFEYARQLARIFCDATEDLEEPYVVCLGFSFMAIYMSATSKGKARKYLTIAAMCVEDIKPQANDPILDQMKFFIREMTFLLAPQQLTLAVSFPLIEAFQHREERLATRSPLNPAPPSISLTESFTFPAFYNYDHRRLNPFIPIFVNGRETPNPLPYMSQDPNVLNLQTLEFLMFTKSVVSHYVPFLVRILQLETVSEEDFELPFGAFPDEVANCLMIRFETVLGLNVPVMNLFGPLLVGVLRSVIFYTQQRFDESKKALDVVGRLRTNMLFHDMALTSPSFLLPPIMLVTCNLFLHLGMINEYETYLVFLRHYESIGYTILQQGFKVLTGLREKLHPTPQTPPEVSSSSSSTNMMHPVGTSSEITMTHYAPPRPGEPVGTPQFESPGDMISSPFNFLGQDLDTALDSSDLELTPMDMMFSFLDPANEEKVLEELGPLLAEMERKT